MKAIILAAGRGSRMGKLTEEKPKCLIDIEGAPLIELQIKALRQCRIHEIAIVTGYKAPYLEEYGTQKFHNPNWETTNMVSSLLCAKEWLVEDDCIVSYSDIFYTDKIVNDLIKCEDEVSISYDPQWLALWEKRFDDPLEDAESFQLDAEGFVLDIGKKVSIISEIQGQYMGLLKFRPSFWKNEQMVTSPKLDMTTFLSQLIEKGFRIKAVANEDPWGEIDSESDVHLFEKGKMD